MIKRKRNPEKLTKEQLVKHLPKLVKIAQKVYDEWDQDEEGYDEILGTGGICDEIAEKFCDYIIRIIKHDAFSYYDEYSTHTCCIVYDDNTAYVLNLPADVYEKGYLYTWKKRKDVIIKENDFEIIKVKRSDYVDNNGEPYA